MARHREPVLVIGLGRFGVSVASRLVALGTPVVAVDNDPRVVARLATDFERIMVADTTDEQALAQIDVSMFSRAVVAIGTDQEASILTTALLAEAKMESIWAKALSAQHARILRKVGAHHVVLPEQEMGQRVAHLVDEDVSDYFEITPGWVVVKTRPLEEMVGRPLADVPAKLLDGVAVIAYRPKQAADFQPFGQANRLNYGDEILVMGPPRAVDRFTDRI